MQAPAQQLLEEFLQRLFIDADSPISTALALLKDGAMLRLSAPGGLAACEKRGGEISLSDPEGATSLFEIRIEEREDVRRLMRVGSAAEFSALFIAMAREGRLRLDILLPFIDLWSMGVGLFLQEVGILSEPSEYAELIRPLQLRDIAFTEILDVHYLQDLVNELAEITGVRLWVMDMNSMPVVVSVAGGEHCKLIIDSLEGVMRCYDSSIGGLAELKRDMRPRVRICHAGFVCFDAPLILGGEMVGMISGDASLSGPADPAKYRRLAEELHIDPGALLASLAQVRSVNIAEVEFLLSVVNAIAQVVTEMSFKQYLLSEQIKENRDLTRELWFKNAELKALFQSFVEIQERERAAVARDLHDDTGQNLTNALLNLELALNEEGTAEEARERIESASLSISRVVKQLHDLSASLHPPVLDDLGLVEALRNLIRRMNADHPIEFSLVTSGAEGELAGERKINLYRIVQEALNNVVKHSGASEAVVRLSRGRDGLSLTISDNGRGFDEAPDDGRVRLGMVNMRERAEQIGGMFQRMPCKRGVTISVHLPLNGGDRHD